MTKDFSLLNLQYCLLFAFERIRLFLASIIFGLLVVPIPFGLYQKQIRRYMPYQTLRSMRKKASTQELLVTSPTASLKMVQAQQWQRVICCLLIKLVEGVTPHQGDIFWTSSAAPNKKHLIIAPEKRLH